MFLVLLIAAFSVAVHGCGQKPFMHGVVSGTTSAPNAWPWQIQLIGRGQHFCGGSLISDRYVVTAAHCVTDRNGRPQSPSGITIRLGGHRRSGSEPGVQTIRVSQIFVHESYKNLKNDIALIRLASPASLTKTVNTVCLPSGRARAGAQCYITGWGRTMGGGSLAGTLQQARMPIIEDSTCRSAMSRINPNYDTNSMVCAGIKNNPVSGCQGDSGGPFVCQEGGQWVLHGAVSWGDQNCKAGQTFTAFARVSNFVSWIRSKMSGGGGTGPSPPTQPPSNCLDLRPDCFRYLHYCRYQWGMQNCKKSCGYC